MKKALLLALHRSIEGDVVKDGGPAFTEQFVRALRRNGYNVDFLSGNTTPGVRQFQELPPFLQRLRKGEDFARRVDLSVFGVYDLIAFIHPSTLMGFVGMPLPALERSVLFPTLLGAEYARFMEVPKEYLSREREALGIPLRIQCPSRAQARILTDIYGVPADRVLVQPRGFSPELFPPLLREKPERFTAQRPFKLFVANAIRPQKGHGHLIDLAARCREAGFPIRVVLYGDLEGSNEAYRSYAGAFIGRIRALGLGQAFEMHQAVEQKHLSAEMQKADAAIVPSIYESFGKSALEASASGLPTIVFDDVSAYREFLDERSAIFVRRDTEALFQAVTRLANDADFYGALSAGGISNGEKYAAEAVYDGLVGQLEECVKVQAL